jgi:2-polyprenyl-3-methyl-5-hydroxy-6-metoxy-1,4-benzoquinol methylase
MSSVVDLGTAPHSNAYKTKDQLNRSDNWYPLRVMVCEKCWLVQTEDFADFQELFAEDYAYFSSFSSTWLEHAKDYVSANVKRFNLTQESHVIEVAANDGYLLQYVKDLNIPCTGIEPTASTANAAKNKGIPIIVDFFGEKLASELVREGKQADLIVANNVLAHVPDINDFVSGFSRVLKPDGVATFEFPHLLNLVNENQFDTIYHEHFSYLSLTAVLQIFKSNGMSVFDVEQISTHGGSLRVYAQRSDTGCILCRSSVIDMQTHELKSGITTLEYYKSFQLRTNKIKNDFLSFLLDAKRNDKSVVAYGAAAKGNTLINYSGIRSDLISFVVDRNPSKKNKFLPGSRIEIVDESCITETKPDFVVILPWNLKKEISKQLEYIREWDGQFVTAIPEITIS